MDTNKGEDADLNGLLILRILLHVAAAVALIQFAEKIVSWFIKDWIRNQPDDATPKRTAEWLPHFAGFCSIPMLRDWGRLGCQL
jgi:hypothetical protein